MIALGGGVLRLRRISLVVSDLGAAAAFYRDALDFEPLGGAKRPGRAFGTLMGDPALRAETMRLRLGGQELELVRFDPPGRAYPSSSTAADSWFQHFCIPVADMPAAYRRLRARGDVIPISSEGPERLPPNTGSVTAYKFRDPEGHPLELSAFPPGVGPAAWHARRGDALFLGIDHSAIVVADTGASIAFYRDSLGLALTATTQNRGVEQHRLDGLASAAVDIAVLQPAEPTSPHVEFLQYHVGDTPRASAVPRPNDIAATRLVLDVADLTRLIDAMPPDRLDMVSDGIVTADDGTSAILIRDRDGHLLQLQDDQAAREKR